MQVGLTIPQALEHSLPQLKMLAQAAVRIRSGQALLDLNIAVTGTAAGYGNDSGGKMLKKLQRDLKKTAGA